jgi:PAS domain S-box-containing protein
VRPSNVWRLGVLAFAIACVALAAVGWTAYQRLVELREADRWVEHTLAVREEMESVLSLLKDAETGERGFLITGEPSYLAPYRTALASLPAHRDLLRRLVADNRRQQANVASLDDLIPQELSKLDETIAARERAGIGAAAEIVRSNQGKLLMDRIQAVTEAMRIEEDRLLSERGAQKDHAARIAIVTTVSALGFALGLMLCATVLLSSAVRARGRESAARNTAEAVTAAVSESAARLRATLTSIGDAVIVTDDQGRVTLLNVVAQALTGWTEEEAAGRPSDDIFVIVNEQSRAPAENPVHRVLREGVISGLANHTLLISKDGRDVPIDDSAAPIKAADGSLLGAIIVFRDIAERRKADERFRLAVEAAPTALVMVDQRGTILVVNALTEQLFGYTRQELLGQPIEQLVPQRFRDRHPKDRASFFAEPSRRPMGAGRELYGTRKDGTEIAVEIGLSPFKTGEGLFVLAAIADITERKREERRQAMQHAVTRALAESPDLKDAAVAILQAICVDLEWDVGALWTVDPVAGVMRCVDVCHRPSVTFVEFEAITRKRTFAPGVGLVGRVWASGELAWIPDVTKDDNFPRARVAAREGLHGAFAIPIRLGGAVHGVIESFSREIRQPDRELLATMASISSQIGQFIARRRAEEERARLLAGERAARQEAESAIRAKDEFLAMLGHELRNPLGAISNAVGVLDLTGNQDGNAVRARDIIVRQTEHLARLVDDLLDVGRVMAGKIILHRRPVDLGGLVRRSIEALSTARSGDQHVLAVDAASVWIAADVVRIEQVVGNLLSNAAKYTPAGGRIHVTVKREAGDAVISVEDTGRGIAADLLPRIFDLFVQGPQVSNRELGGLGVGLTLVRRLVELHGGTVDASSDGRGRGSTFTVRLPGVIAPIVDAPSARPSEEKASPRRILIAEDNGDFRAGLKQLLTLKGHEVYEAADGPGAVETMLCEDPDVALIDIGLPGLDGYEVARRVRSRPGGPDIVLIALTGYGLETDRQRVREAGFDFHLVKPATPEQLDEVLSKIKDRGGDSRP